MRSFLHPWAWFVVLAITVVAITVVAQGLWGRDRAEVAEDRRIAALIERLGHESFAEREAAGDELQKTGKRALPALRAAASQHASLEVRQRAANSVRAILLSFAQSKSTKLALSLIHPGVVERGSPPTESGRAADETAHRVRLTNAFLLGTYEITQEQFQQVMKFNPSWFQEAGDGKDKVVGQSTDRFPVDRVTWYDAIAFCNQLSIDDDDEPYYELADIEHNGHSISKATVTVRGGSGYRLPTEAEWEYACRAGTSTAYHFGAAGGNGNQSNVKGVTTAGGYGGRIVGPNLERTTRVGSYQPNRWGLYDMHGNAAEWCWDWYGKNSYEASPENDPLGPKQGDHRVLRGGSWLVGETSSRSASRLMQSPGEATYFSGFRVARSP